MPQAAPSASSFKRQTRSSSLGFSFSFSIAIIQCNYTNKPALKLFFAPVPPQQHAPVALLYSPSASAVWLLLSDFSLHQFLLRPDPQLGHYILALQQSVPALCAPSEASAPRRACLGSLGERCVAVALEEGANARLHFLHAELMNEIAAMDLPAVPSGLVFHRNQLFLLVKGSLLVSEVALSALSLKDVIRHAAEPLAHSSKRLHVDSQVRSVAPTVLEMPFGICGGEEWAKCMAPSEAFSKEEKAVLEESEEGFEAKALEFIRSRVAANHSVISLSNEFLQRFIQRCIRPNHTILASVLQKLIRSGVDLSVNPNILEAILEAKDLVTLLFYLQFASFISERDLIKIWTYCLAADKAMISQFAAWCHWTEKKPFALRRK